MSEPDGVKACCHATALSRGPKFGLDGLGCMLLDVPSRAIGWQHTSVMGTGGPHECDDFWVATRRSRRRQVTTSCDGPDDAMLLVGGTVLQPGVTTRRSPLRNSLNWVQNDGSVTQADRDGGQGRMGLDEDVTCQDPLAGDPRLPGYFGDAWPAMLRFDGLLRVHGVERGLLGPRETARLWERHLINSAAVVPFIAGADSVLDLGSGAGLPGVVVGAMLPATSVTLLEPKERRVMWLEEVVDDLELANVTVLRGRAEDVSGQLSVEVVVARAVGSLSQLYGWAAPLLADGGRLVALKGARAADEMDAGRRAAQRAGLTTVDVSAAPTLEGIAPTTVVVARRGENGD